MDTFFIENFATPCNVIAALVVLAFVSAGFRLFR